MLRGNFPQEDNRKSVIIFPSRFRCRREIISQYFSEVWNDSKCNKMCDRCYHIDCVKIPKIDITNHIFDLHTIMESAEAIDVKLTGTKLLDAW